ncbi:MAG: SusC/RagA family TonB-linked outer membrane protein, partial [Mariniphaga sp.]|nr:SusC/RagA family TonB-linked outer membrane protein [Mariniphaga sp.]
MKKFWKPPFSINKKAKKLILTMKLTVFILFLTLMQVSATVYSQATKFSFRAENKQVVEVLRQIEEKSDFRFFFLREQVDVERKVTVTAREATVEQILDELFRGEPVSYEFANEALIVLTRSGNPLGSVSGYLEGNMQQPAISGTVTDESGQPLPGVTVLVKGTTQGTVTNSDGNYSLTNIPENATLVFSFVGMLTEEIEVGNQSSIYVSMKVDAIGIEEVVAIGYGTMRKSDLTGSVAQVKTESLEAIPVYNMEQALKSQAAGVTVRQNSGKPGGRIEVTIRGGNSMIGDNQPLYVVDGFPITGDISFLNPSDIESVDILKDASATAIYGARGANGVVIITSKRGRIGQESRIEINSMSGVAVESNRYEMLDAKQYAEVANEWLKNSGREPYFNLNDVQNPGTNWQDFIFRNTMINNHTLTFSGSTSKTRFSLSGNFYDQEGIIKYTGVKKGTFRLNLDHEFNKIISLAVNLNLSRSETKNRPTDAGTFGNTMLSGALSAPPTIPVYDENGDVIRIGQAYIWSEAQMNNPAVYFPPSRSIGLNNFAIGNATLNINFTNELSLNSLFGLEYGNGFGDNFSPIIFPNDRGAGSQSSSSRNSVLIENILTYAKTFSEKHKLNVIGGNTYQTFMGRNFGIGVSGFSNNTTENYNLGAAETINNPSSGYSEWTLLSWLGRA